MLRILHPDRACVCVPDPETFRVLESNGRSRGEDGGEAGEWRRRRGRRRRKARDKGQGMAVGRCEQSSLGCLPGLVLLARVGLGRYGCGMLEGTGA